MIVTPMEAEKDTKRHAQIEWLPEASSLSSGNKSSWVANQENSYFALKKKIYHFSEPFTMYGKQAPLSATWCQVLCIQAERDRRDADLFGGENRGVLAVLDSSQWKLDSHEWIVTGILVAFHFCRILFQSFFGSPKLEQERFSCPEISWSADCVQEAGEALHQKSDGKDQRSTWFGGLSPSIRKHMQCIDLRVGASEQFNLSDVDHEDQPYSTVRCIVVETNHSNIDCFLINIVSWWWHQRRRQRKTKMKNMKEMLTNWACDGDDSR